MREVDEDPHQHEYEPAAHEELFLETLWALEVPFLTAIKNEYYATRGWKVCGASSIALGWPLNLYTGIPLQEKITLLQECIRLVVDIKKQHQFDHVLLRYYMATLGDLRMILEEDHDLYSFTNEAADAIDLNILLGDGTPNDSANYSDLMAAMHSPAALSGEVLLPSGRVHSVPDWGEPICRVIRATIAACPELEPVVEDWPVAKYVWPTDS